MAAGRVDVSRRRVSSYGWSGKDVATVLRGRRNHRAASGAHSFEFRRSGFSCANEERELGGLWGRKGVDQSPGLEDGEIRKEEDGVQMPPEKKRKFAPIIWDLEDKKVARTGSSVITSFAASAAKLHQLTVVSDEDSVIESASLHLETRGDDDLDPGEVEEDGVVEARNISQSRWASDDESPRESTISYKRSSPEDFEFRIEVSVGDESTFYGSNDSDCRLSNGGEENSGNELESDEPMDCNEDDHDGDTYMEPDDDIDKKEETERGINMLESCRSVFEFEKLNEISEGTYGKVFKARDKKNGKLVALKKVKMNVGGYRNLEVYGFPISALREMNILLSLQHPSIVNVQEVVLDDLDGVYMVMEYMEHDLKGVMQVMKHPFSTSEVKCLMLQLLEGVKYLHDNWVIHRDLKTPNLLLNNQGELKICDFGMSRQYGSPLKPYTSLVVTLWYRAPELLFGEKQYSTAIDMWSVGCIMAELLAKEPLFNGKSEIDQLHKIFKTLGTPNETIWPGLSKLPGAKANFVENPYNLLRKKFPAASFTGTSVLSESGFDLLNRLLTYDPAERITAEAALNHPWFQEVPLPKSKEFMPTFPSQTARNA